MFACKRIQLPSPSAIAATSPEGRGFKYCVYQYLKALRARRGKSLHTPKSVAGSGTQSQVSRRLFCFFFLRLKKEDNGQPRTSVPTVRKQAFINSLTPKSVAGATRQNFAPTLKRCGVWDTVASVPTTFLLLFSSPEKRSY